MIVGPCQLLFGLIVQMFVIQMVSIKDNEPGVFLTLSGRGV